MSLADDAMEQVGKLFTENQQLRTELADEAARAETAEARLARRAELDAAAKPLDDHMRRLRGESDRLVQEHMAALGIENCELRTEVEQLHALAAELGDEWGVRWPDGEIEIADDETEARDWAHNDAGLVLLRRLVGDWRPADATDGQDAEGAQDGQSGTETGSQNAEDSFPTDAGNGPQRGCGDDNRTTGQGKATGGIITADAPIPSLGDGCTLPALGDHKPDVTITITQYEPTPEVHDQMRQALLKYYMGTSRGARKRRGTT